jgi:hypothetical protein
MVLKRRYDNENASVQGLVLFILMLIFGFSSYMWLTVPLSDGVSSSVTAFWASSTTVPDAAYTAGFANIAALNSSSTIAMLIMILSGLSFLIVALRAKSGVN